MQTQQTQTKELVNDIRVDGAYQAYHFTIDTDSIATHLMKERPSLGSHVEGGRVPPLIDCDTYYFNPNTINRYDKRYAEAAPKENN